MATMLGVAILGMTLVSPVLMHTSANTHKDRSIYEAERLNRVRLHTFLAPCPDYDFLREYDQRRREIVRRAQPIEPELRAEILPAFSPELTVELYWKHDSYHLGIVRFEESAWSAANREVPVTFHSYAVSHATAEALRTEWQRSVAAARPGFWAGVDGWFLQLEIDGQCAHAWAPEDGSRNAHLGWVVRAISELHETDLSYLLDSIDVLPDDFPPVPAKLPNDHPAALPYPGH